MTNTDNLESSLLASILLKICCIVQVEFCYKLHMSSCRGRVPSSMKCVVQVKSQVMSVGNIYPYIALPSTIVYTEVQWNAHLESQEQGWQAESVNAS